MSAWHWYFSAALPKALLPAALAGLLLGVKAEGQRTVALLGPAVCFVAVRTGCSPDNPCDCICDYICTSISRV